MSSDVTGEDCVSAADLNFKVPEAGSYAAASLSRARCVSNTVTSFKLSRSAPIVGAKVVSKSSREKILELGEVAVLSTCSSTIFAAACVGFS